MSLRGSVRFWSLGPFEYHVWVHALDPRQRRIYDVSLRLHTWRVWPPRGVLDPDTEFTLTSRQACLAQLAHCLDLLQTQYK